MPSKRQSVSDEQRAAETSDAAAPAQRLPAEVEFARELDALRTADRHERPAGWLLSPRAIRDFLCGKSDSVEGAHGSVSIERKFYGDDALIERAIVTLATQRGLMLIGEPGTAKSMLSELLAAAISGDSRLTIQGSAATTEDQIKYSWNYALLLAKGPTRAALVPAPLFSGMSAGKTVRFEEITRCPIEVQDVIVPMLSERMMMVPELAGEDAVVSARPGFNIIATANTRDRGVNEMSAALKRRFNFETVRPIAKLGDELELVQREVARQLENLRVEVQVDRNVTELLVTTFHELREGKTADGAALEQPAEVISTAEAVAVCLGASLHAKYYGEGALRPEDLVAHLSGSILKDADDRKALANYFRVVAKARAGENQLWKRYYKAGKEL